MQFSRARRLSSDRRMYHGACLLSVLASASCHALANSHTTVHMTSTSIGLSFHCRSGSWMRASNRCSCSCLPTSSQILISMIPPSTMYFFDLRTEIQKSIVLLVGAKSHHVFDAGAIVPAAIEDDDFAGRWISFDVALHEHLGLLTVGGSRKGDDSKHPRTHSFRDGFDGSTFAGGISSLQQDDDTRSLRLDPFLQVAKLDLQLSQFLLVDFTFHLSVVSTFCFNARLHHLLLTSYAYLERRSSRGPCAWQAL